MFLQKTRALEKNIEKLLSKLVQMGLLFRESAKTYFGGNIEDFEHFVEESDKLESEIDHIRKDIEMSLYSDMLIPESRGDVFRILESLDDVADSIEAILLEYSIEKPVFPVDTFTDMLKIADMSCSCIEKLIQAVTSFFISAERLETYIQEVKFFESEIDRLEEKVKRKVFSNNEVTDLAVKMQLRFFIEHTCDLSDFAEEVCERLAISRVKRSI